MKILDRIDELCKERGWTTYELTLRSKVSENTIYNWKKRGSYPTISILTNICEAFEITLEQFFTNFDDGKLLPEQQRILKEWVGLTEIEKDSILKIIENLKAGRS